MTAPPPGWYPEPNAAVATLRWWDGTQWGEHRMPFNIPEVTAPNGLPLAEWHYRLFAYIIDSIILTIPVMIGWFVWVFTWMDGYFGEIERLETMSDAEVNDAMMAYFLEMFGWMIAIMAISIILQFTYSALFLKWRGATPGKLALRLRVVSSESTDELTWEQIVKRSGTQYVLFGIGNVVYLNWLDGLWPLWDKRKQALHDKAGRTQVVQLEGKNAQ